MGAHSVSVKRIPSSTSHMRNCRAFTPIFGALGIFGVATLCATPLGKVGVFAYSSLCHGAEDSGGAKIVLLRGPEGITAIYWRTEGPIMAPLFAYGPAITLDDRVGRISIHFVDPDVPGPAKDIRITGSVSEEALTLSGDASRVIQLPRLKQIEVKLPECGR